MEEPVADSATYLALGQKPRTMPWRAGRKVQFGIAWCILETAALVLLWIDRLNEREGEGSKSPRFRREVAVPPHLLSQYLTCYHSAGSNSATRGYILAELPSRHDSDSNLSFEFACILIVTGSGTRPPSALFQFKRPSAYGEVNWSKK